MAIILKYKYYILTWVIFFTFNIIEASLKCDIWIIKEVLILINLVYFISFFIQYAIICPELLIKKNKFWFIVLSFVNTLIALISTIFITTQIPYNGCELNGASQEDFSNFMESDIYNLPFLFTTIKMNVVIVLSAIIAFVSKQKLSQTLQIKEMETRYLKSQISPHFLLNSLNNIYSLAIQKSDDIVPRIENLSELLKYSLYKIEYNEIALSDEIQHIKLYLNTIIDKRKDQINISIDIKDRPSSKIKIKPLILFTFIENAIKHSDIEINNEAKISLEIDFKENVLFFKLVNTISQQDYEKQFSGIGLENTKNRLERYYKNEYTLIINETQNIYEVKLQINYE